MPRRFTLSAFVLSLLATLSADAQHKLTVSAGEFDRRDCVVPVDWGGKPIGFRTLRDDAGNVAYLRPNGDGHAAIFILRGELKAGQSRTYRVVADTPSEPRDRVRVWCDDYRVKFTGSEHDILQYQGARTPLPQGYDPAFRRGGYIHPVYTPSGKLVTDDYPPKHKHHHGIWSPWTKTEFEGRSPDFWNMGQKTGTVEFVKLQRAWGGPIFGGFVTEHRMVDMTAQPPKPAINERWEVVVYEQLGSVRPMNVFDMTITQTCASDSPLVLPKYHYGGLGFRGHRQWEAKDNCFFLTSEGKDRGNGNETTGKWCHVGGKVDGEMAGVAILCHPDNFRFPQPMRLNPDEPFFCYAPSQGGDWRIEPGKPYVARYRFVVADGPSDKDEIERLWNDYANPPKVTAD